MGVFNARSHPAAPGRGCVTPLVAKFGAHQRRVFGARMCSSETISSKKPKESSVCESRLEFLHSLGRFRAPAPERRGGYAFWPKVTLWRVAAGLAARRYSPNRY